MFEESSKRRGVFRARVSIYSGAFLWAYLTAYYFCNKSSVIDVQLVYKGLLKYWNFQSQEGGANHCNCYIAFLVVINFQIETGC